MNSSCLRYFWHWKISGMNGSDTGQFWQLTFLATNGSGDFSKIGIWGEGFFLLLMLYPPGLYHVKKPKRFVILSSDKSSECNLSRLFFDIIKPRRIEHLQKEEPFFSYPYFSNGSGDSSVDSSDYLVTLSHNLKKILCCIL